MPRRGKSSILSDISDIFSMLPWWAGVIAAAGCYFYLNSLAVAPVLEGIKPSEVMIESLKYHGASLGRYLLPAIILLGSLKSFLDHAKRKSLRTTASRNDTARTAFESISWREFEMLVGEYFRAQGYKVSETGGVADGGVDLRIRSSDGLLYLVQCKHWKTSKVSVNVVRELFGVMQAESAVGAYVVTSGDFTADAAAFAKNQSISLIDGAMLVRSMKSQVHTNSLPSSSAISAPITIDPIPANECPHCKSAMVLRTAKRGERAGQSFYGCIRYPSCKGTRSC